MKNSIGGRIKALRAGKRWTQEMLAEKLNVTQSLVAKIETDRRRLATEEVIRLAEIYGASTDYILRGVSPEYVNVERDSGLSEGSVKRLREITQKTTAKELPGFIEATSENISAKAIRSRRRWDT